MQVPEIQKEHRWLQRLVGDWTFEAECQMGPDQEPMRNEGRESVRSLGGLWTLGEGAIELPEVGTVQTIMTLGYDPESKLFVGTFIASMMTHLWTYRGSLNAAGTVLTLDTEGPGLSGDGSMVQYQDIIEFSDDDHRSLSSQILGADGRWQPFNTTHYRRKT